MNKRRIGFNQRNFIEVRTALNLQERAKTVDILIYKVAPSDQRSTQFARKSIWAQLNYLISSFSKSLLSNKNVLLANMIPGLDITFSF